MVGLTLLKNIWMKGLTIHLKRDHEVSWSYNQQLFQCLDVTS